MFYWDYNLPEDWEPKTDKEWEWYLTRKINYDDWKGLKREIIKKHFAVIKKELDPGKRLMLENFLRKYD